jgi:hypothetical protein
LPRGQFAHNRLLAAADAAFEKRLAERDAAGIEPRLARIVRLACGSCRDRHPSAPAPTTR